MVLELHWGFKLITYGNEPRVTDLTKHNKQICQKCSATIAATSAKRAPFMPLIWRPQGVQWTFFLFPRLKNIMKGANFTVVAAIQECVTSVLRSIPKETIAVTFQKL
jgi:hypothetical protein